MNALQGFKDQMAQSAYGMTKADAITQAVCIDCKQPNPLARCKTEAGRREYYISGMCEECWDKLFSEVEE